MTSSSSLSLSDSIDKGISPLWLAVGALSVAPFCILYDEEVSFFFVILFIGAWAGGRALLAMIPQLTRLTSLSSICRWTVRLLLWSTVTFILFPIYALFLDLPFDPIRAAMSWGVSICIALFFFLGLRIRAYPKVHYSFLYGTVIAGIAYLAVLFYVSWSLGYLGSLSLLWWRTKLTDAISTWPSRYPVVLIMLAFISLSLRCRSARRPSWVLLACTWAFLVMAACSLTRAAWVGLAVAFMMFPFFRLPGWKSSLCAAVIMAQAFAATSFWDRARVFTPDGLVESSSATRIAIWTRSLEAMLDSPVFGYGQQGTGVVLGEIETGDDVVNRASAHNDYVDVGVRSGFPGLFMYFAIVGSLLRLGWRFRLQESMRSSTYLIAGMAGALGYAFFHELLRSPFAGSLFWYLAGSLAWEEAQHATSSRSLARSTFAQPGPRQFSEA